MPNFKPKASKKITVNNKSIVTLDSKHNEKMKEFQDIIDNIIPNLLKEKRQIKLRLTQNITLTEKMDLLDKIRDIRQQIKRLKKKKKNYLLNNSKYIFEYFEKKKNISKNFEKKKTVMHSFFNKN